MIKMIEKLKSKKRTAYRKTVAGIVLCCMLISLIIPLSSVLADTDDDAQKSTELESDQNLKEDDLKNAASVRAGRYKVCLDGTLGLGPSKSLVQLFC